MSSSDKDDKMSLISTHLICILREGLSLGYEQLVLAFPLFRSVCC